MDENITLDEQKQILRNKKVFDNAVVVSNILELTSSVMSRISSDDVSTAIDGNGITKGVLLSLVASRLKNRLLKNNRGASNAE